MQEKLFEEPIKPETKYVADFKVQTFGEDGIKIEIPSYSRVRVLTAVGWITVHQNGLVERNKL